MKGLDKEERLFRNTSLHLLDKKDHKEVFWATETPVLISN
jgi:hypothetical protein